MTQKGSLMSINQEDKDVLRSLFTKVGDIAMAIADLNDQKKATIEGAIEDLGLDPKEHKEKIAELKQAAALAAKAAVKARDGDSEWVDAYLELQQTAVSMVKGETQ